MVESAFDSPGNEDDTTPREEGGGYCAVLQLDSNLYLCRREGVEPEVFSRTELWVSAIVNTTMTVE